MPSVRWPRGLVIGKFLPPHRGHHHLVRTAEAFCERLDVMVCVREDDPIPGELRVAWMRETHPRANVHHVPDDLPADDTALWATETRRFLGRAPDVVFSSEAYGPPYAALLGAAHVGVDDVRAAWPVSGTLVRRDPLAAFDWLEPCARAWFAPRIVVLGAESTGTTTLAVALARDLGVPCVPEFGRTYTYAKAAAGETEWPEADFLRIAAEQNALDEVAARATRSVVVADTDAFATGVWHEYYRETRSPAVEALARRADLYLLTLPDIPFEDDGWREGEHRRAWMTAVFRERLRETGRRWEEVGGSDFAARLARARGWVEGLLGESGHRWSRGE